MHLTRTQSLNYAIKTRPTVMNEEEGMCMGWYGLYILEQETHVYMVAHAEVRRRSAWGDSI